MTIDFGIDLGTTNSTIAVADGAEARTINNQIGSALTPSALWLDRRNQLRVGQEAKLRALIEDPDNADLEFKLRMGRPGGSKTFARDGRTLAPEEMSAEVLKQLRSDARTAIGEDVQAAVITVPAAFENPATAATVAAAKMAGLELSPLLQEPVAASLAYGLQTASDNIFWLVYDFGGGTFDAAVMRIRDGMIHVENYDGDNYLGGKLLDWDIVEKLLIPAARRQFNMPGLARENRQAYAAVGKLKYHAETAKVEVCRTRSPFEIYIENWATDDSGKTVDFVYNLTPKEVEAITLPYITRSLNLCTQTLKGAGLPASALERVLMVGGSTLNPWIRDAVAAELRTPLDFGIDPVTVVARGAAIFASTVENSLVRVAAASAPGEWDITLDHQVAGNEPDPDLFGQVTPPAGQSCEGCTIEFVDQASRWRSGRIRLSASGRFQTRLEALHEGRHVYAIELCNPTGTRLSANRDATQYTYRKITIASQPATHTIGIGLADGGVAVYINKGESLPARKLLDHISTVRLRAGNAADVLRIPILEGEHERARRNYCIGEMTICGDQLERDLQPGSDLEITMEMDTSMQIVCKAHLPSLDADYDLRVTRMSAQATVDDMLADVTREKDRLAKARETARRVGAPGAEELLARIDHERLLEQIDGLARSAATDADSRGQLDRRLKELGSIIDQLEDAIEWPELLAQARSERKDTTELVADSGSDDDKARLRKLEQDFDRAVAGQDHHALSRLKSELISMWIDIRERQPSYHIGVFNYLAGQKSRMTDQAQAARVIASGEQAKANGDVSGLKAVNQQLRRLLPTGGGEEKRDRREGDTVQRRF
jgi:molecular chaperone DnaK